MKHSAHRVKVWWKRSRNFRQNLSAENSTKAERKKFDEGREILPKIRELSHHNLTLCAECFIRNYVSRVQKHSLPK